MIAIFALFASVTNAGANEVGSKNRKANKHYSKGQYEEALKLYDEALQIDPADGKLMMNRGSTLYRLNELDEAEKSYQDALPRLSPNDKKAVADAHYNLGNVNFKQGEQLEAAGNAASARGKYSQALDNYINTLKLRPSDMDAKWNLQLAHQKVNLLENQQDQEQNQDNKDEGDNQKKDDKGGKDDRKDQNKDDNKDNNDQSNKDDKDKDQNQNQQDQQQQPQNQEEQDMKKEEAQRLIEQYADDADTLNKPRFQRGKIRQPEKDW